MTVQTRCAFDLLVVDRSFFDEYQAKIAKALRQRGAFCFSRKSIKIKQKIPASHRSQASHRRAVRLRLVNSEALGIPGPCVSEQCRNRHASFPQNRGDVELSSLNVPNRLANHLMQFDSRIVGSQIWANIEPSNLTKFLKFRRLGPQVGLKLRIFGPIVSYTGLGSLPCRTGNLARAPSCG